MLVLSRKLNEQIVIDENTVITIVRIGRENVRIGITAPRGINIRRGELDKRPPATRALADHVKSLLAEVHRLRELNLNDTVSVES